MITYPLKKVHYRARFSHILLLFLLILAFGFRLMPILTGAVSFHYDMGRDAFIAEQIWKKYDLKIQGPPTSTPGLYHGVLYYYLIAIGYQIGDGNPVIPSIELAFINSLTVIPIYLLAAGLFKKKRLGFLAALLFALSFEANQFAPWLSNPAPVEFFLAWFFYGLFLWYKGNNNGFLLATIFAGLCSQFQFFFIYLYFVVFIFGWYFNLKVEKWVFLKSLIIVFIIFGSFIFSFIKFGTLMAALNGFLSITSGADYDFRVRFSEELLGYINKFTDIYVNNFIPLNITLGGLLGISSLLISYRNRFIFFSLLSNLPLYFFGGHNSNYSNIGMATPAILSIILFLQYVHKSSLRLSLSIFILITISNLYMIFKFANLGQTTLVLQDDMILRNQVSLINKSYEVAGGREFGINTLTLPLWTNTTWAYLYSQYGIKKYGYLPCFYGRDPIGQLGQDVFKKCTGIPKKSFYIIEPPTGINEELIKNEINSENSKTLLANEYKFGQILLQERLPLEK